MGKLSVEWLEDFSGQAEFFFFGRWLDKFSVGWVGLVRILFGMNRILPGAGRTDRNPLGRERSEFFQRWTGWVRIISGVQRTGQHSFKRRERFKILSGAVGSRWDQSGVSRFKKQSHVHSCNLILDPFGAIKIPCSLALSDERPTAGGVCCFFFFFNFLPSPLWKYKTLLSSSRTWFLSPKKKNLFIAAIH